MAQSYTPRIAIRIKNLLPNPQDWGLVGILIIVMLGCTLSTTTDLEDMVVISSPDPDQVTRDVQAIISGMYRARSRSVARQKGYFTEPPERLFQ
jgi:hypothetical protein